MAPQNQYRVRLMVEIMFKLNKCMVKMGLELKTMGLSTQFLGSISDADRASGSKDHDASTQLRSRSELRDRAPGCDGAPGQCVRFSPAVQCT